MSDPLTFTVATTAEELDELREPWRRLQGAHSATDPDVFETLLAAMNAVRPHVLLLRRGGEPVAIVLGRIEDIRLSTKVGYRTIVAPHVRALTVVYRGVLGELSTADAEAVLAELRRSLRSSAADVLRLRNLPVGSALHRAATTTPPFLLREHSERPTRHWDLSLPGSFDEFMRSLSRSTREGAKRYTKKLEKEFGDRLELVRYRDLADAERVFSDLRAVAEKTYQQGLGVSFAQTDVQRRVIELFMERGWFRAYVLYVDKEPVAFWQGHEYNGVFSIGVPGYDPAYADLRVGNYVLFKLIEDLCADPSVQTLDYGFGDAEYKRRFGTRSWEEQNVHVFSPTPRGIGLSISRRLTLGLTAVARAGLEQRGVVARVKRLWRDRLSDERKRSR